MNTIKLGCKGMEVTLLQNKLKEQGYSIQDAEGIFDAFTHQAVLDFQQKKELGADGIVGYRSWEALLFATHPSGDKLTDADFTLVASLLDCEATALKAVQRVETGGRGGFFAPGKPAILFEGHIFWNQLKKRELRPEDYVQGHEDILYPQWEKSHYRGGPSEYERLEQARQIHPEAADASASWGMFQIMGFNYAACGESTVASFVQSMCESECKQLLLSARFIRRSGMLPALQQKNWTEFARRYNGPAYAQNQYDQKLAATYEKEK